MSSYSLNKSLSCRFIPLNGIAFVMPKSIRFFQANGTHRCPGEHVVCSRRLSDVRSVMGSDPDGIGIWLAQLGRAAYQEYAGRRFDSCTRRVNNPLWPRKRPPQRPEGGNVSSAEPLRASVVEGRGGNPSLPSKHEWKSKKHEHCLAACIFGFTKVNRRRRLSRRSSPE